MLFFETFSKLKELKMVGLPEVRSKENRSSSQTLADRDYVGFRLETRTA